MSNIPFASFGEWTGYSMLGAVQRVHLRGLRERANWYQPSQSGGSVDGEQRHERRERLVQPHAVPPAHRDEVAEPLVRELVGHDVGDVELLAVRDVAGSTSSTDSR